MSHFTFDPTITLGNVLTILTGVVAVVAAYVKLRERLIVLETMVRPMWRWWTKADAEKSPDELEHEGRELLHRAGLRRELRERKA